MGDFEGDIEKFLSAHTKWEGEQDGAAPVDATEPGAGEEAKAGEEAATEAESAAAATEPDEDDEVAITPDIFSTYEKEDAAFKAALDGNPKLKGHIYKLSREAAKAAPILEMFSGSVSAAKFARETSDRFAGMKYALMACETDPSKIGDAFNVVLDEFTYKDSEGKPVLDAKGQPTLGKDFEVFGNHLLKLRDDGLVAEIEEKIKADQWANYSERENYEAARDAMAFMTKFRDAETNDLSEPDISGLPEDVKAHLAREKAKLAKERERLGLSTAEQKQAASQQAAQQHQQKFWGTIGKEMSKRISDTIAEKVSAGAFIPSYMLDQKDPATGAPLIHKAIYTKFSQLVRSMGDVRDKNERLQSAPPSERTLNEWLAYNRELVDQHLPAIIDAEVRQIQKQDKADRAKKANTGAQARAQVEPEPRGGSVPRAKVASDEDIFAQAKETVRAKNPNLGEWELKDKALIEYSRLTAGR
jgi:hypothetical protein